jgi:hypothetical protein
MGRKTNDPDTTLSTRFNERELNVLRKAAEAKKWSLARLLRLGAIEKAVHILNAAKPEMLAVRDLLTKVARQLRVPQTEEPLFSGDGSGEGSGDGSGDGSGSGGADKLVMAIARLGAELAPMLTQELAALNVHGFDNLMDPATVALADTPEPAQAQDDRSTGSDGVDLMPPKPAPRSRSRGKTKRKTEKPSEGGAA